MTTMEVELTGIVGRHELFQHQAPEQFCKNPHGQEEARLARHPTIAIWRQTTTGDDHVYMGMVRHRRTPGVEHRDHTDFGSEVFGVTRNRQDGLGGRLHEQIINHALILICNIGNRHWQRKHDVEVWYRQQLGFARFHPVARHCALALGAMPIAAGVVGDRCVMTVITTRNMATELCRAAPLDRAHHLHLVETDVAGIDRTPCRSMVTEDIRDLQRWTGHIRRRLL